MIKLKKIHFAYSAQVILKDFSLTIQQGELTCLLGSSGSGKSTILRLIAGLEIPQLGEVIINKHLVAEAGVNKTLPSKRNVGFVFQDLALWPHFTVYENIAFGLKQKKKVGVRQSVLEILSFFGLEEHEEKYPNQLSGGQKQLVAIARSLVLEPDILLMDEPLSDLDVKLKRKLLEHIKKLKSHFNTTIVYVTHDHREAFAVADKVVVLDKGAIQATGTVEEITQSTDTFVQYFLEY